MNEALTGHAQGETVQDEYTRLGITDETWACVGIMSEDDAMRYTWELARYGEPVRIARDPDGKRYHVAVRGGLKRSPVAWLASFRPESLENIPVCEAINGQHPQVDNPGRNRA